MCSNEAFMRETESQRSKTRLLCVKEDVIKHGIASSDIERCRSHCDLQSE
jgi:hypothetical protein